MSQRLMDANPNSFRKLVATFLEANGRGYWDASGEAKARRTDNICLLRCISTSLLDKPALAPSRAALLLFHYQWLLSKPPV